MDLEKQLQFPREIPRTLVIWSAACKMALMVELTIPWEGGLEAAHEQKHAKYCDLAAECRENYGSEWASVKKNKTAILAVIQLNLFVMLQTHLY